MLNNEQSKTKQYHFYRLPVFETKEDYVQKK